MSKQARVPTDPQTLKPIIEAMIFASEEPLSARSLIRLLVGDREDEQPEDAPLAAMIDAAETSADASADAAAEPAQEPAIADTADAGNAPAEESGAEEAAAEETAAEGTSVEEDSAGEIPVEEPAVDDAPVDDSPVEPEPVETLTVETPAEEGENGDTETGDAPDEGEIAAAEDLALEAEIAAARAVELDEGVLDAPIAAEASIIAEEDIDDEEIADEVIDDNADAPTGMIDDTTIDGDAGELAEAMALAMEGRPAEPLRPRLEGPRPLDQAYVRDIITELNDDYAESGRVFRIVEVAGGFQFATVREYGEFVAMLSKEKLRRRLSPAALETLSIIAYRQPVSKPEVEAIRGVNCDQVLVNLMEKNLIAITGRSEAVGRPLLYGTTEDFLRSFGLKGLGDLPKLREIEELMEDDAYSPEKIEVITVDAATDVEEIEARVGAAGHSGEEAQDGLPINDDERMLPIEDAAADDVAAATDEEGAELAAEATDAESDIDGVIIEVVEEVADEEIEEEDEIDEEEMEDEIDDEELNDEMDDDELDDEELEDEDLDDEIEADEEADDVIEDAAPAPATNDGDESAGAPDEIPHDVSAA